jgi:TonB family protein
MKHLLLLVCLLTLPLLAGAKTLTLKFVEAKTSTAIPGLEVQIKSGKKKIAQAITDAEGKLTFESKLTAFSIEILNQRDRYEAGPLTVSLGMESGDVYTVNVRWCRALEDQMIEAMQARDAETIATIQQKGMMAMDTQLDQEATFPGGAIAQAQYIQETVRYPETSQEMNEQGMVYVAFVVESDGTLSAACIVRSVSPDLDREALLLVLYMPDWNPGLKDGRPTAMQYVLPIKFTLS